MTRPLTAEDQLEIKRVLVLWGLHEDRGESDAWAGLFAADGRCTFGNGDTIVGREALARSSRERWGDPASRSKIHWMGDAVITATDEGAHVVHYCMILDLGENGAQVKKVSERSYDFVQEEGRWCVKARTYSPLPRNA